MIPRIDIAGHRFGRLVAVSPTSIRSPKGVLATAWVCSCDCGQTITVRTRSLRSARSSSCGCLQKELTVARFSKHGATTVKARWPEWNVWRAMINRCHSPKNRAFKWYGARGISVCDRWRFGDGEKTGFECYIADLGRRPSPELTVDRRDNDGNYEPGNCRWATAKEQVHNSRRYAA